MGAAISNLAFKASLDVTGLKSGADFTKSEINKIQRESQAAAKAMISDAERYKNYQKTMAEAVKAGIVSEAEGAAILKRKHDDLTATLKKEKEAQDALHKTAGQRVTDVLGKVPIADKFAGGIGQGVDFLGGNLGTIAAAAVVGGLVAKTVNDVWQKAEEQVQVLKDQKKTARKLGIDQREYMGLAGIGEEKGVASESLQLGLHKLSENIGEAKLGDEGAQKKFKSLGITWKELQGIPLDKQFEVVNAAINKHADANERAALAQSIYGKGAKELGPLLSMTADQINHAKLAMEHRGQLLSQEDVNRLNTALAKSKEMKAIQEGVARQSAPGRAEFDATVDQAKAGFFMMFKYASDALHATKEFIRPTFKTEGDKQYEMALATKNRGYGARESGELSESQQIGKQKLEEKIEALEREAKTVNMSSEAASIWNEALKTGNLELGKQVIKLQESVNARREIAAEVKKLDVEADLIGADKRFQASNKMRAEGKFGQATGMELTTGVTDEESHLRGKEKRNWERQGEFDAGESLRKARQAASVMGLASEAAAIAEAKHLGATKATIAAMIEKKNVEQMSKLMFDEGAKAAESYFKHLEVANQEKLQAAGGGKVGGMSAKERAKEETDEARQRYEIEKMIWRLKQEGAKDDGPNGIKAQVAARRKMFADEKQEREDNKRQKLLDEAQSAKESLHPEIAYKNDLAEYRKLLKAKLMTEEDFVRLSVKAKKDLEAKEGPTHVGVEGMKIGSMEEVLHRQELQQRQQTEIDARADAEQEAKKVREEQEAEISAKAEAAQEAKRKAESGELAGQFRQIQLDPVAMDALQLIEANTRPAANPPAELIVQSF